MHPLSPANAILSIDDYASVHKYSSYSVASAFGKLLSLGTEAYSTDNFRREVYALAAVSDTEGAILVATGNYSGSLVISLTGASFGSYSIKGMLGGGRRGAGYATAEDNIPIGSGVIRLKVGKSEVYLITLS